MMLIDTITALLAISNIMAATVGATGFGKSQIVPPSHNRNTPDVAFLAVGQTVHRLEYANIEFHVDVEETIKYLKIFEEKLWIGVQNAQNGTYNQAKRKASHNHARRLILRANGVLANLDSVFDNRHHHLGKRAGRVRRFDPISVGILLLIGLAVGGTLYGIFHTSEVHDMAYLDSTISASGIDLAKSVKDNARSIGEMNAYIKETASAIDDKSQNHYVGTGYMDNIDYVGAEEQVFAIADSRLQMLECALASAAQHRLCPLLLQEIDVEKAASQVQNYAHSRNMVPLAGFRTDWLQHEVSFVKNTGKYTKGAFTLYVHIPIIHLGSTLNLFKHVDLPIDVGHDIQLHINSPKNHIAISADGSKFKVMSQADLMDCRRYGTFYACPRGNWVTKAPPIHIRDNPAAFTNNPATCMWALHEQQYDIATATCDHTLRSNSDGVEQLGPNDFAVFATAPHQGTVTCRPDASAKSKKISLHGLSIVHLRPGCTCETRHFEFAASDIAFSRDASNWGVQFVWPPHIRANITQGLHIPSYKPIFDKITRRDHASSVRLQLAIKQLQKVKKVADEEPSTVDHKVWASATTATGIAVIALIVSICAFRRNGKPGPPPATTTAVSFTAPETVRFTPSKHPVLQDPTAPPLPPQRNCSSSEAAASATYQNTLPPWMPGSLPALTPGAA
jgi:hypothetical protein